jgi:hypothetical protein
MEHNEEVEDPMRDGRNRNRGSGLQRAVLAGAAWTASYRRVLASSRRSDRAAAAFGISSGGR